MNKTLFCLSSLLIFVSVIISAQDETNPDSVKKTFDLKLSGSHEFDYRVPLDFKDDDNALNYDGEMKRPMFKNELGVDVNEGNISFVSHWQIDTYVSSNQSGTDSWSGTTRVHILENYIGWHPDNLKMGFGYQIYSWGVADGRNPTDNINPINYTTIAENKPQKIPVLSASANWYPTENVSIETVFVPIAENSIFPLDYKSLLEEEGFSNVSYKAIENEPANFIAGGKLNYRSTAFDCSASYLYDYDSFYTPVIHVDSSGNETSIELERERIHRIGLDAKTTIDRYGIWAEGCYSVTGNYDASKYSKRLSRIDYTLGFDFNYGPQDDYYVNLQYTGTVIPGFNYHSNTDTSNMETYYQKALVGYLASEREVLVQGLTWNAHWDLAEATIVPTLTGSVNVPFMYDNSKETRYCNLLLRPEIDIMPVDSFHIKAGSVLSYAWIKKNGEGVTLDTTTDSMGIYTPSNNFYISVSYKWNYETAK